MAFQAESEGMIQNVSRLEMPYAKSVNLDFKIDGPYPYTHLDIKQPVGSEILKEQGNSFDIETMGNKIGEKIIAQKERFCKLEEGPKSPENVLHIVDLAYVPPHEQGVVKNAILKGAGSSKGIQFINDFSK